MVIFPCVGAEDIGRPIVPVSRAMPLIGSPFSHHLDLRPYRTVEVSRLTEGVNSEFFNALDRGRHYAGSDTVSLSPAAARKVHCVTNLVSGHVVRVLAAID